MRSRLRQHHLGLLAGLVALALAPPVEGRDPKWGGLAAVAVSPDGGTIVAGGENRVLYVIEAGDLSVRKRIWTEARIGNLAFTSDGSTLLLEDDEEVLRFYDTSTWELRRELKGAGYISTAPSAGLLAALEKSSSRTSTIRFLSMTDGSVAGTVVTEGRVSGFDLSADGKLLLVLSGPAENQETKVASGDVPKELKGIEKKEFQQRNDGKGSTLSSYAVPSGEKKADWELWYSSSDNDTLLARMGDVTWIFNYHNALAKVSDQGEVTLFSTENSYNYGVV